MNIYIFRSFSVGFVLFIAMSLCSPAMSQDNQPVDRDTWVQRLVDLQNGKARPWKKAFALGQNIAELPPDDGLAIVRNAWPKIDSARIKQQIVKAWHFDLPTPFRMRLHPRAYAFFDFVLAKDEPEVNSWVMEYMPKIAWRTFDDPADARQWLADHRDRTPRAVISAALRDWKTQFDAADQDQAIEQLDRLAEVGRPFRRNESLRKLAKEFSLVKTLEKWLHHEALSVNTASRLYGHLLYLKPDQYTHDGYNEFITTLTDRTKQQRRAKLKEQTRAVDGDERKRWILHEPDDDQQPPESGYGLLLVLPGGDGSAEFASFVGSTIASAAGDTYLVAQLIAPPIDKDNRNAVVWPTERLGDDRVDFTIESVAEAVIHDITGKHDIDTQRIFVMGWSSGGPPAYTLATRKNTPFRGAFVAMSVFKPDLLPPLKELNDRAFYILHSPGDFISMRFANNAEQELRAAGARVKLSTYEGGHGWHGESIDHIPRAVRWLEGSNIASDEPD